jgi:hypothetical protein
MTNEWQQPPNRPPALFAGDKERDLTHQVGNELIERVMGTEVFYYPISRELTNYHSLYGEAITKTFLPAIRVYAVIAWEGYKTETTELGIDKRPSIKIHFHHRRLTTDQDLNVTVGDFVKYGDSYFEITELNEPTPVFGHIEHQVEIEAMCIKARKGLFQGHDE